jgi:hypothetical protein
MISFVSYVEAHIRGNTSYLNREARAYVRPPLASIILQPRQPLPGILDFGLAGVGVLSEVETIGEQEFQVLVGAPLQGSG